TILATFPDLVVSSVSATPSAVAGNDTIAVHYTVTNQGLGGTRSTHWRDEVYLSDNPDPFAAGARSTTLGDLDHNGALDIGGTYSGDATYKLAPNDRGKYIVVQTNIVEGLSGRGV